MTSTPDHVVIDPAILYFGTPVVLIATVNDDGSPNLAPISSAFWLGRRAVLGFGRTSHSVANLRRTAEVTVNLPSAAQVGAVDRLALTTGADPVPDSKRRRGYRHVADKFGRAGLTPVPGGSVAAPRVAECPVAMEATVDRIVDDGAWLVLAAVRRVYIDPALRMAGHEHRIDPDRWRPLIMSFQRFYGLGAEVHPSRLATIDEELYR